MYDVKYIVLHLVQKILCGSLGLPKAVFASYSFSEGRLGLNYASWKKIGIMIDPNKNLLRKTIGKG
jgi:hypothetical protein